MRQLSQTLLRRAPALLVAAVFAGSAPPAFGQIYSWYDSRGMLILSNVPSNPSARLIFQGEKKRRYVATGNPSRYRGQYDAAIKDSASRNSLDPDLVRSVIQVESGFNPYAVSRKGAQGLMQLMPATADRFGVTNVFDPAQNIEGGTQYLRVLLDLFRGDTRLALAAYNAGETVVQQLQEVPPFRETRDYVRKVTGLTGGAAEAVQSASASTRPRQTVIYKYTERIGGREIVHYSDVRPRNSVYQIVRPGS